MGRIRLNNMSFMCKLGLGELERSEPQEVIISVLLTLDLSKAGRSNVIDDTVDYVQVHQFIKQIAEQGEFTLIESLADTIARNTLERFKVDKIRIIITKKPADLTPHHMDSVTVDIIRKYRDLVEFGEDHA